MRKARWYADTICEECGVERPETTQHCPVCGTIDYTIEYITVCSGCGAFCPDDERVGSGMVCGRCASKIKVEV